jgi:signal transduction histidine kinase
MAAGAAASTPPLQLGDAVRQPVDPHMTFLFDASGQLGLQELIRQHADGFRPMTPDSPGLGFHTGRVWVRFEIRNDTPTVQERWLFQDWPFQESVVLYLVGPDGQVSKTVSGGEVALAQRPLQSRHLLFPVRLAAGEHQTAYVSISGRAATLIRLVMWQPAHLAADLEWRAAMKYLALGSTSVVAIFCTIAWRVRGQPALLLGIPAYMAMICVQMILDGFAVGVLPADGSLWQNRTISALALVIMGCHLLFARSFLNSAQNRPRLARVLLASGLLVLLSVPLPLLVLIPQLAPVGTVMTATVLSAVAWRCMRDEGSSSRLYLATWGVLWVTVIVRNLHQLGWLPQQYPLEGLMTLGLVLSSLTLSYSLYDSVLRFRRLAAAAQRTLIEQQRTEQARLQQQIEVTTRHLQAATRAAEEASLAKSAFLSIMSHELRAPLHTILGYSGLLKDRSDPEQQAWLQAIERSGGRLLRLFEQVLSYSREAHGTAPLQLAATPLSSVLEDLVLDCQPLATRHGNQLELHVQDELPPWVQADEQRLVQTLRNLLDNACKYTRQGRIALEVAARPAASGSHCVSFAVTDTGPGIPADLQATIFMPFSRLSRDRQQPGVGLGLAIAHQMVASMGGELKLSSDGGGGCRFWFEIELTPASPPALAEDSRPVPGSNHAGGRPQMPAEDPPAAPPQTALRTPALPSATLDRLRSMLVLGQVLAIERLAAEMATEHPACAPFMNELRLRCVALDLRGLAEMLDGSEPGATTGEAPADRQASRQEPSMPS